MNFQFLMREEFIKLRDSLEMQEMYLDVLVLLDDVLCEFVPDRRHARIGFDDLQKWLGALRKALKQLDVKLYENVDANMETSMALASRMRSLEREPDPDKWLKHSEEAVAFLGGVLTSYRTLIMLPRPESKESFEKDLPI